MKPGIDPAALNSTVRPQDDLFEHVNGTWLEATEIPQDKAIYGSFHMLADASEAAVKEIRQASGVTNVNDPAAESGYEALKKYGIEYDERYVWD